MSNFVYTMKNVALICPTKDRPEKILRLLENLSQLLEKPGQILIADGGFGLEGVVEAFTNRLNVHHLKCPDPGQILQRNYAHGHLNPEVKLVAHIDDDITFEARSFSKMLKFWNEQSQDDKVLIAGVSFNLLDLKPITSGFLRGLFFMSPDPVGTVSSSGYARPFLPAKSDISVEWLLGGATVWNRSVICDKLHPLSVRTKWAVCEDLMYSYPLRHVHRMLVCCGAEAYHNENYKLIPFKTSVFHGVSSTVMRHHFVMCNRELSIVAFLWMTLGIISGHAIEAIRGDKRALGLSIGMIKGLFWIIISRFRNLSSIDLVKELSSSDV